jgi:hypothetical protein
MRTDLSMLLAMWKCPSVSCPATSSEPVRVTKPGDTIDALRCSGECERVYSEPAFRWCDDVVSGSIPSGD